MCGNEEQEWSDCGTVMHSLDGQRDTKRRGDMHGHRQALPNSTKCMRDATCEEAQADARERGTKVKRVSEKERGREKATESQSSVNRS